MRSMKQTQPPILPSTHVFSLAIQPEITLKMGLGQATGSAQINGIPEASGTLDTDPLFVMDGAGGVSGTWTALPAYTAATNQTVLTDNTADFNHNELACFLINPDTSQSKQPLILSNTQTQITVLGDVTGFAPNGASYEVIDYRLEQTSPGIDTGSSANAPLFDIVNAFRPYDVSGQGSNGTGTEFDIGAYEFNPGTTIMLQTKMGAEAGVGFSRLAPGDRDRLILKASPFTLLAIGPQPLLEASQECSMRRKTALISLEHSQRLWM